MFTGLITHLGTVESIDGGVFVLACDDLPDVAIGASIACSGVCLTVTQKTPRSFTVDVSEETLSKSTLSDWKAGDLINLEYSLRMGDELGGHLVSGHVDDTIKMIDKTPDGDSHILSFEMKESLKPFIVSKGSVALNGISLTVNDVSDDMFNVTIIPHTHEMTNLKVVKPGDLVNVEIDMLARYVAKQLEIQNGK